MINCKECPFLIIVSSMLGNYECQLDGHFISHELGKDYMDAYPISYNCKLEAVTYSLKDEEESINFVPKEIEMKPTKIICRPGELETARKIINGTDR